jgi:acyl-CoA reductase-like NAD-dependent aldehyde dehydrogenase
VLFKAAELLRERLGEFVELETQQTGRCLREYRAQLGRVPEWLEHHGAYAASHGFEGRLPPLTDQADHVNLVWRVPLGVCGIISPWNHPLLIATKKIAVALAAANSLVVKPPEEAPLTVLKFASLLEEAGLPSGTLQVVSGEGSIAGEALVKHPLIERVDFTGGTSTGTRIAVAMAEAGRVKPYCAELGGNAPIVVFDDVRSVDEAVNGVAFAAFVASGQTCVSGKRILVQRGIHDEFLEKLVEKVTALRLGDPMSLDTDLGPVISQRQLLRVEDQVNRARTGGAKALCGGDRPSVSRCGLAGHFYEPTVLANVAPDNVAFVEEIFGPVVSVSAFSTEPEAVKLANTSQYGLGGAIWTADVRKAHRIARQMRCGVMWVNCHHRNDPSSPWGGFGQSGIGRENGPEAFEEYTTTQSLTIRTSDAQENWFGDPSARYS